MGNNAAVTWRRAGQAMRGSEAYQRTELAGSCTKTAVSDPDLTDPLPLLLPDTWFCNLTELGGIRRKHFENSDLYLEWAGFPPMPSDTWFGNCLWITKFGTLGLAIFEGFQKGLDGLSKGFQKPIKQGRWPNPDLSKRRPNLTGSKSERGTVAPPLRNGRQVGRIVL